VLAGFDQVEVEQGPRQGDVAEAHFVRAEFGAPALSADSRARLRGGRVEGVEQGFRLEHVFGLGLRFEGADFLGELVLGLLGLEGFQGFVDGEDVVGQLGEFGQGDGLDDFAGASSSRGWARCRRG
jgi:hypothetical protein